MNHIEFVVQYGDIPFNYFENYLKNQKEKIITEPFDYKKFFNKQGFYKAELSDDGASNNMQQWGIEEVHDLTASINQWQIVEEESKDTISPLQSSGEKVSDRSVLLTQSFRDNLSAELEEVDWYLISS